MIKKLLIAIILFSLMICPAEGAYRKSKGYDSKPVGPVEIDWSNPLSRGLVGCWLMNEGGGKILVDLSNHYNGTISGPTWSYGNLNTDGSVGNTVNFPDVTKLSKIDTFTAFFRIKTSTDSKTIYAQQNSNPLVYIIVGTFGWGSAVAHKLSLGHRKNDGSQLQSFSSLKTIDDGVWHTCLIRYLGGAVVAYPGTSLYFYVDSPVIDASFGTFANDQQTDCSGVGSIHNLFLGDGNNRFNGSIAFFYYWDRNLSPSEIQSLYVNPYQIFVAPKRRTISNVLPANIRNRTFLID